jgi:hypothetical protein
VLFNISLAIAVIAEQSSRVILLQLISNKERAKSKAFFAGSTGFL